MAHDHPEQGMIRHIRGRLLALALGAATVHTLRLHTRQQRAHAVLAFAAHRQQLLAAQIERPELRVGWTPLQGVAPDRQAQLLHHQAQVELWTAGYQAQLLSLGEIRAAAQLLFATASGSDFWQWACTWNTGLPYGYRDLRVHEALDDVYGALAQEHRDTAQHSPAPASASASASAEGNTDMTDLRLTSPEARQERAGITAALRRELDAAGLKSLLDLGVPTGDPAEPIALNSLSLTEATNLTHLVHQALRPAYDVAAELDRVAELHKLARFPTAQVIDGEIHTGSMPVVTADRLATLLGAPPLPDGVVPEDLGEHFEAEPLLDRLTAAFRTVTRGRDAPVLEFEPYCPRGCGDARVVLGALSVPTARDVVTALNCGAPEEGTA
ncbi:DUF6082 family protein [Streptomyces sp. NPDC004111]|uniref:DUF6082 family protein n=1 Tax=Streptomyces sp. NPDC004111 TaxID=3364690 RepID=UPI0036BA8E77